MRYSTPRPGGASPATTAAQTCGERCLQCWVEARYIEVVDDREERGGGCRGGGGAVLSPVWRGREGVLKPPAAADSNHVAVRRSAVRCSSTNPQLRASPSDINFSSRYCPVKVTPLLANIAAEL